MRCVCGKEHLKTLLTHWLNHANLQLIASGATAWPIALEPGPSGTDNSTFSLGRVVGELAVERESLSHVWTGSPEAMECILNALIGGTGSQAREPGLPLLDPSPGYGREFAFL